MRTLNIPSSRLTVAIIVTFILLIFASLYISIGPLLTLGVLIFFAIVFVIFRNPFWGLLLTIFSLPFERLGAYETSLGTLRPSQVLLAITLVAWLWQGLVRRRLSFRPYVIALPVALFLLVNLIGLFQAKNFDRSALVLLITLVTVVMSWVVVNLVTRERALYRVIQVLLVSATLVCLFGLYQFVGDIAGLPPAMTGLRELYTKAVFGFPRIQSTALEPLYFANYLLIPFSLLYALFLGRSRRINLWVLISLLILLGVNVILTVSRGGYLGLLASAVVISSIYLRSFFSWKKIIFLVLMLVMVYVVAVRFLGLGGGQLNVETFISHVRNVFVGPAYQERLETLESALGAFKDSPLVGIGPGGFGPYVATYPYLQPVGGWRIVNNEFIELLAETGIIGLGLFLWMMIILCFRSLKAIRRRSNPFRKAITVGCFGALIGILVQYQTFSILYIMHVWFLIGLMIASQNLILSDNQVTSSDA